MPSIIEDVEKQVRARMAELEPAVAEYDKLKQILATFQASEAPPAARRATKVTRRRGGAAPSRREEQALELIVGTPGITVAEIAEKLEIGPTYLYRLLPKLEREGRVRKVDKGYHAVAN